MSVYVVLFLSFGIVRLFLVLVLCCVLHVCVYVNVKVCTYISLYQLVYNIYIYIYDNAHAYMYIYIYICTHRERYMYICIYICVYLSLSLYIYIYMHIDIFGLVVTSGVSRETSTTL